MRAEVVAVGTELLLGDIANDNAREISEALAGIGVDVLFHTVVGDNEERIAGVISRAIERADVVIVTGGLGPTHDDVTREAIARATGVPLERRPELEAWLRERFARMSRVMPEANLRQADLPRGAEVIENPTGTAPGFALTLDGKRIYAVPGVPREMRGMLADRVLPDLRGPAGGATLVSRVLRVVGLGESDVGERLAAVIEDLDRQREATLALLAGGGEVRVRITAKGTSPQRALERIEPVERRVRGILGSAVYGADADTLEGVVAALLRQRRLTLAIAESVSGGMLTSRLLGVPGASDFLLAAYVAYSRTSKVDDLFVPASVLERHGTVSAEAALCMAAGARARTGADVAVATTGEAGPEPAEAEVGMVYLGLAHLDGSLHRRFVAPGDREAIRRWASQAALNLLRLWLTGEAG